MLVGLEGTPIVVSAISTIGVIGVGFLGYLGIRSQLTKSTDMNTVQHGGVANAVRSMESTLKDVDATLGLLVSTQGFPLFKSTGDGLLIWANSAALELLGLPFEDLADSNIWPTVIHPEDRDRVKANWDHQIESGRPAPAIMFRYVHSSSGKVTTVRGMSRPIFEPDGEIREWVSMVVPLYGELDNKHLVLKENPDGLAQL